MHAQDNPDDTARRMNSIYNRCHRLHHGDVRVPEVRSHDMNRSCIAASKRAKIMGNSPVPYAHHDGNAT